MTLVKDDVITEWINKTEHKIREFKENKAEAVFIASLGNGSHNFLSGPEVKERFLFDADKAHLMMCSKFMMK